MHKKSRVLFLTNMLMPYRVPLFNRLSHDVNFRVVALAESEANRQWRISKDEVDFDYQQIAGWHVFIWRWELPIHLNWGVGAALRRYKPDVIIVSGYDTVAYWRAFLYTRIHKKRFILYNESTLLSTTYTKGVIGFLKRFIIRHADTCVVPGEKAREYMDSFGAESEKIVSGIATCDMDFFHHAALRYRELPGFLMERKKYPELLLLFVGQLIPRKGVTEILRALFRLKDADIGLLIVGSGPQEEELAQFCREHRLNNVYFEGYQQQDTLLRYYALADVLILPSLEEVWGLVVNEALASGLFVLCSDRAGAGYDLITEGWNGRLFDLRDGDRLAALIQETKDYIEEIKARRDAISEQSCRDFSIERAARGFLDAIAAVQHNGA